MSRAGRVRGWLRSISLARRMLIMLLLPTTGMLVFAGFYLVGASRQLNEISAYSEVQLRTGSLLPLIAVLQEERGLRYAFSGPERYRVRRQIEDRRARRQQLMDELEQRLAAGWWTERNLPHVWAHFQLVRAHHQELEEWLTREEDAATMGTGIVASPFTVVVNELLALQKRVERLSDEKALYSAQDLVNRLLAIGEQIGRQRALGAWVLVAQGERLENATELLQTRRTIRAGHAALEKLPALAPYQEQLDAALLPLNLGLVEQSLNALEQYFMRLSALRELPAAVGYGGLIHHLKNYVLRGEQRYYLELKRAAQRALQAIDPMLARDDLVPGIRKDLETMRAMVTDYEARAEHAREALKKHELAREVDKVIRYDDRPALNAMERLFSMRLQVSAEEWFALETEHVAAYYGVAYQVRQDSLKSVGALLDALRLERALLVVVVLTLLVLTLGVVMLLYRDFVDAIRASAGVLRRFAERGELVADLPEDRGDEAGQLIDTLRLLLNSNREIIAQTSAIQDHRYERLIEPRSDADELSIAVLDMLTELESYDRMKAEEAQLRADQLELSGMLREATELGDAAGRLLHFFCRRLDATAGCLYALDDAQRMQLVSSYCLNADTIARELRAGDGPAGQAWQDGKLVRVDNVRAGAMVVGTGLGDGRPMEVLALPMVARGQCVAVLELGWAGSSAQPVERLFDAVGELVALGLQALLNRAQIARNAAKLQRQAQDLLEQQEELRASNEELSATAANLRQSEEELRAQQEELQQSNAELNAQRAELARASTYKSEFLANMSHELRTPLNSILVLAQTLEENSEQNLTPEQIEVGHIIRQSGKELLELINDILDISKVEAGQLRVSIEPVLLSDVLGPLRYLFSPLASERGLEFGIDVADSVPQELMTDSLRIGQILRNFLSNAIKFTHQGGVRLRVDTDPDWTGHAQDGLPGKGAVCFRVEDTGIGIRPDALGRVFGAFEQADGSTTRDYGGTGLGLTISSKLAELLGGEVGVESEFGKGSCFYLKLPISEVHEQAGLTDSSTSPAGIRETDLCIIGELDRACLDALAQRTFRHERYASAGAFESDMQCVRPALLLFAAEAVSPALLAAIERLRAQAAFAEKPVLVLVSNPPELSELTRYEALGATILLQSGDISTRLLNEVSAIVGTRKSGAVPRAVLGDTSPQTGVMFDGNRVLMVDDDVRNAFSLSGILRKYGVEMVLADSGARCLERLRDEPDIELVLMDVMMPTMDGLETIRQIRAHISKTLPIIVVTARAMREDFEASMEAGANDYLTKPVDLEKLLQSMHRLLDAGEHG